jgi:ribonuclease HIII
MASEVEKLRVTTFDTITMEDGEWDGPKRDEDVMSYTAKTNGVSITIKKNGTVVFDADYNKGAQIRIVEDVVHLPEGGVPD